MSQEALKTSSEDVEGRRRRPQPELRARPLTLRLSALPPSFRCSVLSDVCYLQRAPFHRPPLVSLPFPSHS